MQKKILTLLPLWLLRSAAVGLVSIVIFIGITSYKITITPNEACAQCVPLPTPPTTSGLYTRTTGGTTALGGWDYCALTQVIRGGFLATSPSCSVNLAAGTWSLVSGSSGTCSARCINF